MRGPRRVRGAQNDGGGVTQAAGVAVVAEFASLLREAFEALPDALVVTLPIGVQVRARLGADQEDQRLAPEETIGAEKLPGVAR
jgi:hypothetical protein